MSDYSSYFEKGHELLHDFNNYIMLLDMALNEAKEYHAKLLQAIKESTSLLENLEAAEGHGIIHPHQTQNQNQIKRIGFELE